MGDDERAKRFVDEVRDPADLPVFNVKGPPLPAMDRHELRAVGYTDDTLQAAYDAAFGEGASVGHLRLDAEAVDSRESMERRAFLFAAVTRDVGRP